MKREYLFVSILLLIVICVLCAFLQGRINLDGDTVLYLSLGESLSTFNGYAINDVAYTKFPPVFPLIIAIVMFFSGSLIIPIKLVIICMAIACLLSYYLLLKMTKKKQWIIWIIPIVGVCFPFIYLSVSIYSEIPYMMFSSLALLFMYKYFQKNTLVNKYLFIGSFCIAISTLTRTIGLVLLITLFFAPLFQYPFKKNIMKFIKKCLLLIVLSLIPLIFWYVRNYLVNGDSVGGDYVVWFFTKNPYATIGGNNSSIGFIQYVSKFLVSVKSYALIFANPDSSLRFSSNSLILSLTSIIISLLWVTGYIFHLLKKRTIIEIYVLFYLGILFCFTWRDIRYFVPILPFIIFYIITTLEFIITFCINKLPVLLKKKEFYLKTSILIIILFMITTNTIFSFASYRGKKLRSPEYQGKSKHYYDASQWVKENASNSNIACMHASIFSYWTKMKIFPIPFSKDEKKIWLYLTENEISYIVVDSFNFAGKTNDYLIPFMKKNASKFILVKAYDETCIYKKEIE